MGAVIFLNGPPKMGNHALWKACELLGIPTNGINHLESKVPREPVLKQRDMLFRVLQWDAIGKETAPRGISAPDSVLLPCFFIKRDPRNALVSWIRYERMPVTQGTIISTMHSFLSMLEKFEGWLTAADTLVVSFERLVKDDSQMREMAAFAGVDYLEDAWPNLPNHTKTWTGRLSNYQEHWSPAVEKAWVQNRGSDLLTRWGY